MSSRPIGRPSKGDRDKLMVLPPVSLGAILRLEAAATSTPIADILLSRLMKAYGIDSADADSIRNLAVSLGFTPDEVDAQVRAILDAQVTRQAAKEMPLSHVA